MHSLRRRVLKQVYQSASDSVFRPMAMGTPAIIHTAMIPITTGLRIIRGQSCTLGRAIIGPMAGAFTTGRTDIIGTCTSAD